MQNSTNNNRDSFTRDRTNLVEQLERAERRARDPRFSSEQRARAYQRAADIRRRINRIAR